MGPKGIFYEATMLSYPYSLMFEAFTNNTFIADPLRNALVQTKVENPVDQFKFSPVPMKEVRSFEMTADSVYVTSPAMGYAAVQFNRTTGAHMLNIDDPMMKEASDVKAFENSLYVC